MAEIIIVIHTLAVGGAERRVSTLAEYMASKGHDVTVLLIDNTNTAYNPRGVKVVCVNQNPDLSNYDETKCALFKIEKSGQSVRDKIRFHLMRLSHSGRLDEAEQMAFLETTYIRPLREYIKLHPGAVVVSFMTIPNISVMAAVANLGNRAVFSDCTDVHYEYPEGHPYNTFRERFYGRADAAIFQTEDEASFYTFLPDTPKYVIPNFIKSDTLPERFTGKRRKEIVNFCRLNVAKNLPLLIDAFELFSKDYPDYTLAIIGEGNCYDMLIKYIEDKNLASKVRIRPFDPDVHNTVRDAAMFVSSSDREGISNSMLEALAIGLPCVCTDCAGGGARMMIEDHVNGLIVPVRDSEKMCLAMKEIAEDPAFAEKLSENAVKIRERLRPDVICERMTEAILGEKDK